MSEEEDQRPERKWEYSEREGGAERIYANQVNLTWTGVDVTLIFGELPHKIGDFQAAVLEIEHHAMITMPWPVAKLLAANLSDLLSKYESNNDVELKMPGQYKVP